MEGQLIAKALYDEYYISKQEAEATAGISRLNTANCHKKELIEITTVQAKISFQIHLEQYFIKPSRPAVQQNSIQERQLRQAMQKKENP